MSERAIKNLLLKVKRDISKNSKLIRYLSDTKKVHIFSISVEATEFEVLTQLINSNPPYPIDDRVRKIVHEGAKKINKKAWEYVNSSGRNGIPKEDIFGNANNFEVIIREGSRSVVFRGAERKLKKLSYFSTIKEFYKPEVKKLITQLNKYYKTLGKDIPKISRNFDRQGEKGFLDLGHREGSEIANQQLREADRQLLSAFTSKTRKTKLNNKQLETLGYDLSLLKRDSIPKDVIFVTLESSAVNRDTREEKVILNEFRNKVDEALERLEGNLALFEGSDSRAKKEQKRVIKAFENNIVESKNLKKLTKNNTKEKKSSGKKQTVPISPKRNRRGAVRQAAVSTKGLERLNKQNSSESAVSLLALLSQKITQTVAENMNYPALRYRTGRFARSVKITDIALTARGYPSIGYTYMKRPYQTFENADKWGLQRDPRKLIDSSIREIAAQLLVGRFYTRRV